MLLRKSVYARPNFRRLDYLLSASRDCYFHSTEDECDLTEPIIWMDVFHSSGKFINYGGSICSFNQLRYTTIGH